MLVVLDPVLTPSKYIGDGFTFADNAYALKKAMSVLAVGKT